MEGGGGVVGGVRASKTGNKTLMFELYAMPLPKTHGAECPTYGLLNLNRVTFNGTVNFCECRKREPLRGCGGMPPRNFSNLKVLKRNLFPALSGR